MNEPELVSLANKSQVIDVGEVSPHNKALYEAGKTLLVDSVSTGREFCKNMIGVCTGAIPLYLGILAFILPKEYALGMTRSILISVPAIMFLLACVVFTFGYLPVTGRFSLDLVGEIEREINKSIRHRSALIKIGFTVFVVGTLTAILVIVLNFGAR